MTAPVAVFECLGGPLDGEFRACGLSVQAQRGGVYVLDDTPHGAHWTWIPLGEA